MEKKKTPTSKLQVKKLSKNALNDIFGGKYMISSFKYGNEQYSDAWNDVNGDGLWNGQENGFLAVGGTIYNIPYK